MGKRGPAKVPTARKRAENMPSLAKANKQEPEVDVLSHAPPAPQNLGAYARAEWNRVAPIMVDVGMLTALDLVTLSAYCDAFGTWRTACDLIAAAALKEPTYAGLIVLGPSGAPYLNPAQGVRQAAADKMVRYAAQLGLTPSSRASISVGERGGITKPKAPREAGIAEKYGL